MAEGFRFHKSEVFKDAANRLEEWLKRYGPTAVDAFLAARFGSTRVEERRVRELLDKEEYSLRGENELWRDLKEAELFIRWGRATEEIEGKLPKEYRRMKKRARRDKPDAEEADLVRGANVAFDSKRLSLFGLRFVAPLLFSMWERQNDQHTRIRYTDEHFTGCAGRGMFEHSSGLFFYDCVTVIDPYQGGGFTQPYTANHCRTVIRETAEILNVAQSLSP